jgi:hypothetical protein
VRKRLAVLVLILAAFGLQTMISTAEAGQRRKRPRRTVVVVHKHFPIHRPLRRVYVRPLVRPYRVTPRLFLPLFTWVGVVSTPIPARDLYVWEDGETLAGENDWTEFALNCENRGAGLWLEVASGRVRFDWAEVVFENGETQVVDMNESVCDPGRYPLLDFADGRTVDHVRMVAKSETPEARVVLRMRK